MNPVYAAFAFLIGATALAQPPDPPIIVGSIGAPPGPVRPPLALLLDDFRIVDGDVRKTADGYEVRRGKAIEAIAARRVLFAGESLADVQQFLKSRATTMSPASAESVKFFAAKVQPVLTNSCANCHARADHASRFKIIRAPEGSALTDSLAKNATIASAFLTPADLANSSLLVKSITAHGGQRTPSLHGRTHPAFRNLEIWAQMAVPKTAATASKAAEPAGTPTAKSSTPVNDPFDPALFNRTAHQHSKQ